SGEFHFNMRSRGASQPVPASLGILLCPPVSMQNVVLSVSEKADGAAPGFTRRARQWTGGFPIATIGARIARLTVVSSQTADRSVGPNEILHGARIVLHGHSHLA